MAGLGTLVNALAILAGSGVGLLFGRIIPERIRKTTMTALGLTTIFLGLQMALDPHVGPASGGAGTYHPNPLVIIGGLVLGSIVGELLELEERLERLGQRIQRCRRLRAQPPGRGTGWSRAS